MVKTKEIEELQEKVYEITSSYLPLDRFFNDITSNSNPNFHKELAYKDLEIITNHIINIQDRLEKLEKVVEILKNSLDLDLEQFFIDNELVLIQIKTHFESAELSQEEYELLKDVLENE